MYVISTAMLSSRQMFFPQNVHVMSSLKTIMYREPFFIISHL